MDLVIHNGGNNPHSSHKERFQIQHGKALFSICTSIITELELSHIDINYNSILNTPERKIITHLHAHTHTYTNKHRRVEGCHSMKQDKVVVIKENGC